MKLAYMWRMNGLSKEPDLANEFLCNLQLQLFFHSIICLLNDASVLIPLNSSGRLFQSLYSKMASSPFDDYKFAFWGIAIAKCS